MRPAYDITPTHDAPEHRKRRWPLLLLLLLLAAGGGAFWATSVGESPLAAPVAPLPPAVVQTGRSGPHPVQRGATPAVVTGSVAQMSGAVATSVAGNQAASTCPTGPAPAPAPAPAPTTAPTTAGDGVQQEISVSVRPGGPVRVSPSNVTVRATSSTVTLGPVDVIDPRGTEAGWVLDASVATPGWSVVSSSTEPVSGLAADVCQPALVSTSSGVPVAAAPVGGGGGTFAVRVVLAGPATGGQVEVQFSVQGTGP